MFSLCSYLSCKFLLFLRNQEVAHYISFVSIICLIYVLENALIKTQDICNVIMSVHFVCVCACACMCACLHTHVHACVSEHICVDSCSACQKV
jgi:hypothetical protein